MLLDQGIEWLEQFNGIRITEPLDKWSKFRALMNITADPTGLPDDFYVLQDKIIAEQYQKRAVTHAKDIKTRLDNIALWRGDITAIDAEGIVNAANSKMLGCFIPLHSCIDNIIMSYAGLQVRRDLIQIMEKKGKDEPNGTCVSTKAYNLPSKFILHTVGPQVATLPSIKDAEDLKNCYLSCLKRADELGLQSLAFCCISTGVFGYPKEAAAKIAVSTVIDYLRLPGPKMKVIFNVFTAEDYKIYDDLLPHQEIEEDGSTLF